MSLSQRIETLRRRHANLDHKLLEEEHRPLPDIIKLHNFKREKLLLKDRIYAMTRVDVEGSDHYYHMPAQERAG